MGRSSRRPPTRAQRTAMRRFEELFAEWRDASGRALEAEHRLWLASLGSRGEPASPALASEALRLREQARTAYLRAMAVLAQCG